MTLFEILKIRVKQVNNFSLKNDGISAYILAGGYTNVFEILKYVLFFRVRYSLS